MHLSDYKKVDGVMLPHKIETSIDGEPNEEWTVEKVQGESQIKATLGRKSSRSQIADSDQLRIAEGRFMDSFLKKLALTLMMLVSFASLAAAQVVQGSGVGSSLRVTVLDQTEAALVIAQVTIVDSRGGERPRRSTAAASRSSRT
jgi:hypothetical protein